MVEDTDRRLAMLEATTASQEKQYAQLHADFRTMTNAINTLNTSVGIMSARLESMSGLPDRVDQNTVAEAVSHALRQQDETNSKRVRELVAVGATIAGIVAGTIISVAQLYFSGVA